MKPQLLIIFCFFSLLSQAKVDPYYKEVEQRGYKHFGDSVVFPDGSKCRILDFNEGICGLEWMTDNYCVEEGQVTWKKSKCCDELIAVKKGDELVCEAKPEEEGGFDFFMFWLGLALPFIVFGYFTISVKRKIKKNKKRMLSDEQS